VIAPRHCFGAVESGIVTLAKPMIAKSESRSFGFCSVKQLLNVSDWTKDHVHAEPGCPSGQFVAAAAFLIIVYD